MIIRSIVMAMNVFCYFLPFILAWCVIRNIISAFTGA